jgi:hypothetical protein
MSETICCIPVAVSSCPLLSAIVSQLFTSRQHWKQMVQSIGAGCLVRKTARHVNVFYERPSYFVYGRKGNDIESGNTQFYEESQLVTNYQIFRQILGWS